MPEPAPDAAGAPLGAVLREAAQRLSSAGVPSPRADAELLCAHTMGASRSEVSLGALMGRTLSPEQQARFDALVTRRAEREPLQHLTGEAAFRGLRLRVGPGVFVPRPETELVAGAAIAEAARLQAAGLDAPVVVDLCTGSGAIAASVADEVPAARVIAVELDDGALAYARENLDGIGVELHQGDARTALPELVAAVDVVVTNPPYVPSACVPQQPEARDFDPPQALYGGGEDGLELPAALLRRAAELLKPCGLLVMEHAEEQGSPLRAAAAEARGPDGQRLWAQSGTLSDLTGAPRYTTFRRTAGPAPAWSEHEHGHEGTCPCVKESTP